MTDINNFPNTWSSGVLIYWLGLQQNKKVSIPVNMNTVEVNLKKKSLNAALILFTTLFSFINIWHNLMRFFQL